jgi:hypothetical protein
MPSKQYLLVFDFGKDEIETSSKMNFTSRKQIAHKDSLGEYEKDVFVSERVLTLYNTCNNNMLWLWLHHGWALTNAYKANV